MSLIFTQLGQVIGSAVLSLALYFSGLFFLFTPFPLFYLSLRAKKKFWFASFLLVILLAVLFYNWVLPPGARFTNMSLLGYYLLITLFLTIGAWRRFSWVHWGAFVAGATTVLVLGGATLVQKLGFFDFSASLAHVIQNISQTLDQAVSSQSLKENRLEVLSFIAQFKVALTFIPKLLPSLIFDFTLFVMILNLALLNLLARQIKPFSWNSPFHRLQLPSFLVWVVIIQGMSIMAFFLKRYSPLFRFGIYGLVILFFQMMTIIVMGLGLADTWFDFRKLQKQPTK